MKARNIPDLLKAQVLKTSLEDSYGTLDFEVRIGLLRTKSRIIRRTPEKEIHFSGVSVFEGNAKVDFGPYAVYVRGKGDNNAFRGRKLLKEFDGAHTFDFNFYNIRDAFCEGGASLEQANFAVRELEKLVTRIKHPTHQLDFGPFK